MTCVHTHADREVEILSPLKFCMLDPLPSSFKMTLDHNKVTQIIQRDPMWLLATSNINQLCHNCKDRKLKWHSAVN